MRRCRHKHIAASLVVVLTYPNVSVINFAILDCLIESLRATYVYPVQNVGNLTCRLAQFIFELLHISLHNEVRKAPCQGRCVAPTASKGFSSARGRHQALWKLTLLGQAGGCLSQPAVSPWYCAVEQMLTLGGASHVRHE